MKRYAKALIIAGSAFSIALLSAAMVGAVAPKLVWNASGSAPLGLYFVENRHPGLGEYALIAPSQSVSAFIQVRGYAPAGVLLIKRIAALPGDEICRERGAIFINKTHVANVQKLDSLGREMPQWAGCFTLKSDEIFLLNEHEMSLDGRYFGATTLQDVAGAAVPVWVREQKR